MAGKNPKPPSTLTKVRQPKLRKPISVPSVPLSNIVVSKREEPEELIPEAEPLPVEEEEKITPIEEESIASFVEEVVVPASVFQAKVYPESAPPPRARVVVKCASLVRRGKKYIQGQTFVVEGKANILKFRSEDYFEVFDL